MRRTTVQRMLAGAAAVATLATACSSATDPKSGATGGLSADEAGALAGALVTQVYAAAGGSANLDRASSAIAASRPSSALQVNLSGVSFTHACPLGGTVTGTVSFTDALDVNGTGSLTGTVTSTPQACVVSARDRNVAVTGAPSVVIAANVPVTAYAQSGTAVFTITGGFTWSGGTCQLAYTANVAASGTGTVSGTVCGQSVSTSF